MNILQHIESKDTFCVTLNPSEPIDASRVISRHHYSHPVFTVRRAAAQSRHGELIRSVRTSYCGAYWGNGFHEDGVNSALKVCRAFGIGLPRTGESRPQFFESQPTEPLLAAAGSCIHA
jgi:predicted NAD/FAD-binding protein